MAVYKFENNLMYCIEPMPGDVVELCGARLKVVEGGPGEVCRNCVLENNSCHADIDQVILDRLCVGTMCDGFIREDGLDIHYEEVKDGQ